MGNWNRASVSQNTVLKVFTAFHNLLKFYLLQSVREFNIMIVKKFMLKLVENDIAI